MAPLDNNPVLKKGTSFRVGSWIFAADDRAASKAAQSTKIFQKFQKLQNTVNSTNSSINSRKSDFQTSTMQPEFNAIKSKTLSKLEEDLEKLLEDSKQETSTDGKILLSNCIRSAEPSLQKKKSKTSFKKTTRKKKQSKNTFSNIDDIDEKIEHCLQKAEDTFNINTLNSAELEQDRAFIKYLEELDEPISKDELAEWSHDIDLFMEGLTKPDKLEAL